MPNRRYNSQIKRPGFLKGGQAKLDANIDGKISGKDFAMLRKKKKKIKEGSVMAGKGLYANIHAKRKRGEKMRKKGAKGAPKASDFKRAKQTART